jgi:hypothetical protein
MKYKYIYYKFLLINNAVIGKKEANRFIIHIKASIEKVVKT